MKNVLDFEKAEAIVMGDGPKQPAEFKHRLILALIPVVALLIRVIGWTLRIQLVDPHGVSPRSHPKEIYIYTFWHNQQVLSTFFFRHFGVRVLVSKSKDGEYAAKALKHFGFDTVRSSSSSGKINALRGLARELQAGYITAITPDGPRGPIYKAQPGAVFLGALSGHKVVPYGCAVSKAWKLHRTWDQFEIPKPFGKAVFIFGEPIKVPRGIDDEKVRELTATLEQQMTEFRERALQMLGRPTPESRPEPRSKKK